MEALIIFSYGSTEHEKQIAHQTGLFILVLSVKLLRSRR